MLFHRLMIAFGIAAMIPAYAQANSQGSTSYGSAGSTSYTAPSVSYGSAGSTSYGSAGSYGATTVTTYTAVETPAPIVARRPVRRVGAAVVRIPARIGKAVVQTARKGVARRSARRSARQQARANANAMRANRVAARFNAAR